jgi:hypothetical protein
MRRTLKAILIASAILTPVAAQAGWQAEAGGTASDVLNAPASGGSLTGSWRCRTIKLGGMTSSKTYSWFRCRISDEGGVLHFEKTSGSQRMGGTLYPDGNSYVYLGASWVKGEHPHGYSGNGASVGSQATPDDQIGRMTATANGARLEMPFPVQESTMDVVELRR